MNEDDRVDPELEARRLSFHLGSLEGVPAKGQLGFVSVEDSPASAKLVMESVASLTGAKEVMPLNFIGMCNDACRVLTGWDEERWADCPFNEPSFPFPWMKDVFVDIMTVVVLGAVLRSHPEMVHGRFVAKWPDSRAAGSVLEGPLLALSYEYSPAKDVAKSPLQLQSALKVRYL